ncbi:MAG: hypothetical protein JWO03_471, partial [Bacteroidetes bacterium]|nr:hypothetical protein [Bacteroidota bacterium]
FIQLIENKYGGYIFYTPLSDLLREWGLVHTADIIDRARLIYEAKKNILEKEKTLEEFAKLYEEHKDFEPLENEFYEIIESERTRMNQYILAHIDRFAHVAQ